MNDDVNYKDSVEKIISDIENENTFITKTIITQEITEENNSENGTPYVSNNQNGMGNVLSPQP